jgi:hypothetical protein
MDKEVEAWDAEQRHHPAGGDPKASTKMCDCYLAASRVSKS